MTLKVLQINRDVRSGNYTFEQLFDSIQTELRHKITIEKVTLPSGLSYWAAMRWARNLSKNFDVYHLTGDVNYLAWAFNAKKTIITIHDLGHYMNTLSGIKRWLYKKIWLDYPLKRVAQIHSISNFTKEKLVEVLKINAHRITVIHNPLLKGFSYCPLMDNPVPVIMQIGSGANKNLEALIEAIKGLKVKLLLVNRLSKELENTLTSNGIQFEKRSDLSFNQLISAYKECDILFFASSYEGFGMPIIEAQAIGRPVITSKVASMPEITQGNYSAHLVDPSSIEQIRKGIIRILEDDTYRDLLIMNGLSNVQRFQLESISNQYLQMYASIKG